MITAIEKIGKPVRAVVMFGPPSATSGFRAGEFYEVILDPNMLSPGGDYIRFDQTFQKTEIHGWQRVEGLTLCEILEDAEPYKEPPVGLLESDNVLCIRAIVKE